MARHRHKQTKNTSTVNKIQPNFHKTNLLKKTVTKFLEEEHLKVSFICAGAEKCINFGSSKSCFVLLTYKQYLQVTINSKISRKNI